MGLRTRAISAVIFVALILGGLLGGPYSFMALFSVVTALCLYEFYNMVLDRYQRRDRVRIGLGIAFGLAPHLIASAVLFGLSPKSRRTVFRDNSCDFSFAFPDVSYMNFLPALSIHSKM